MGWINKSRAHNSHGYINGCLVSIFITFDSDLKIEKTRARWKYRHEVNFGSGFHGWNDNYQVQKN